MAKSYTTCIAQFGGNLSDKDRNILKKIIADKKADGVKSPALEGVNEYLETLKAERAELVARIEKQGGVVESNLDKKTKETDKGVAIYESEAVYSGYEIPRTTTGKTGYSVESVAGSSIQWDLFAASDIPHVVAGSQARDNFFVGYSQVETGQIKSGFDTVNEPEEVAHVVASIRKLAQEVFFAVVTDSKGKILNIIRHTKGTKNQSNVSPLEVVGAIASTEGAKNVWFAHNHPSGSMKASSSDMMITKQLNESMDGLGVKTKGHVIVGDGNNHVFFDLTNNDHVRKITPAKRDKTISITERVLRKSPVKQKEIGSPEEMIEYVDGLESESGLLLMNNRHSPVGVLSLSPDEMNTLREGGRVKRILSAFDKTNAIAVAVFTTEGNKDAALNLGNFLAKHAEIRHLDTLIKGEKTYALSARGESLGEAHKTFFSKSKGIENGLSTQQATTELRKDKRLAKAMDKGLLEVVNSESDIPMGAELFMSSSEIQGATLIRL